MTVTDRSGDAATSPLAASVGLADADLVAMYRTVALARAVDERMWILNRAGRIPFVISGQGHEGAQVGLTWPLQKGHDWIAPFYRSIATCIAFGMSARDIMTAQYATASDPSSGGRQMPGHYGYAEHHLVSVVVAGRDPDPARGRDRAGGEDPAHRPGRGRGDGRGELEPGRRPRGAQLRGDPQAAVRVRGREQRLRDQRPGREGAERQGRRGPRVGVRDPGVIVDGTDVLACYAAAREAVDLARGGGGPTLIEAKVTRLTAHSSDDQQTKYRSADDLEAGKANDPVPIFRAQLRDAGVLTDEIEAAMTAEIPGSSTTPPTTRRASRTRTRRRRSTGSTASTGRARRRRRGTAKPGAEH